MKIKEKQQQGRVWGAETRKGHLCCLCDFAGWRRCEERLFRGACQGRNVVELPGTEAD